MRLIAEIPVEKQMELTKDEIQFILNLCDIAVRAQGINIAAPALSIAQKCQAELNKEQQNAN